MSTERKRQFIKRRKMHYNEFQAVKLARQLIENDDDDDDDGGTDSHLAGAGGDQPVRAETLVAEASDLGQQTADTDMPMDDVV